MVPLLREVLLKTKLGRTLSVAVVLFLLALLGSGCGKEEILATTPAVEVSPKRTQIADQPVTLTWSFWGDPWEVEVTKRVITVFEADHPLIEVEILHEPWPTYFDEVEEWLGGRCPARRYVSRIHPSLRR